MSLPSWQLLVLLVRDYIYCDKLNDKDMKVITIGRSSQNDVPINDGKVSRHHCQIIQHDDGSYSLSDFGSTNGTYVNGHKVHGEVRLSPTDVVKIGDTVLKWKNYFKTVASNKPDGFRGNEPTYAPMSNSTSSGSKMSALSIALILLGSIVVIILLIFAIIHKFEKIDRNPNPDPWRYENGVRTNVPGGDKSKEYSSNPYSTGNGNSVYYNVSGPNKNITTKDSEHYSQSNEVRTKKPSPEGFSAVDLTGTWVWESDDNHFDLTLSRSDEGRLVGGYCAIWGTHHMDCDENNVIKENRTRDNILENTIQIKFVSAAWEGRGTALIKKISDNRIEWKKLSSEGDNLVPDNVVLTRQ